MATNQPTNSGPTAPDDLPPPYSAVVGNQAYGFVVPSAEPFPTTQAGVYPHPKPFTEPGVYPHPAPGVYHQPPTNVMMTSQPLQQNASGPSIPVNMIVPAVVGSEPTTVTCHNCAKVVTTKVIYTTAWHTHLVAGSICVITMMCSLCCLGLVPYCFDTFKDTEHYCPNCNTFLGKSNKC